MSKKVIYETEEVKAFVKTMSSASQFKYRLARQVLGEVGYLRYPMGEKVEGVDDFFVIRILTKGNERFFYCYDDGEMIVVLHGYSKTTKKIPRHELAHALRVKDQLLGGEA